MSDRELAYKKYPQAVIDVATIAYIMLYYLSGCIISLFLYPFISILVALTVQGSEASMVAVLSAFISDFF